MRPAQARGFGGRMAHCAWNAGHRGRDLRGAAAAGTAAPTALETVLGTVLGSDAAGTTGHGTACRTGERHAG